MKSRVTYPFDSKWIINVNEYLNSLIIVELQNLAAYKRRQIVNTASWIIYCAIVISPDWIHWSLIYFSQILMSERVWYYFRPLIILGKNIGFLGNTNWFWDFLTPEHSWDLEKMPFDIFVTYPYQVERIYHLNLAYKGEYIHRYIYCRVPL